MIRGIILLGTNLGHKRENLVRAAEYISTYASILTISSLYESPAWGYQSDSSYLNQALDVTFAGDPEELMDHLLETERAMGRTRNAQGYEDRPIDLDILTVDGVVHHTPKLQIPHPRMQERAFALLPLQEVRPNWEHPIFEKTIGQLVAELPEFECVKVGY